MNKLKKKAEILNLEKQYNALKSEGYNDAISIPDNMVNVGESKESKESGIGRGVSKDTYIKIKQFFKKKYIGLQLWVILTVIIFLIIIITIVIVASTSGGSGSITTAPSPTISPSQLCTQLKTASDNYNDAIKVYNNVNTGDNKDLTQVQLINKLNLLNAYKNFYNTVTSYKGTDLSPLQILNQIQTDYITFKNKSDADQAQLQSDQNLLALYQQNNYLYDNHNCGLFNGLNWFLFIAILLFIVIIIFKFDVHNWFSAHFGRRGFDWRYKLVFSIVILVILGVIIYFGIYKSLFVSSPTLLPTNSP